MKKFLLIALLILPLTYALETGVVIEVEDGTYLGCVELENANAYNVLSEFDSMESGLKMKFDGIITNTPFLREINGIKGESVASNAFSGWNFWVKDGNEFDEPPLLAPGWGMGLGDYEVKQKDVIGVNFGVTEYNPDFTVKTLANKPKFYSFEELCEKLSIEEVEIRVDGDEEKGTIDVKPGSNIRIEVNVENKYGKDELKNVYVKAEFDDFDLEDETDEEDIKEGRDEVFVIRFSVPQDAQDEDSLEITVYGESGRQEFETSIEYEIEVDKEKHELIFSDISGGLIDCNNRFELNVELTNQGEEDEDVKLNIISAELNINEINEFELEENDKINKEFVFGLQDIKEGEYQVNVLAEYSNEQISENTIAFKRDCNGVSAKQISSNVVKKSVVVKQGELEYTQNIQEFPYLIIILLTIGIIAGILIIVLLTK